MGQDIKLTARCKWLPVMQVAAAAGIVLFWICFFAIENSNPPHTDIYLAYERSFPLPDLLWITPLLLLSAYWLKKGNARGVIAAIAAGGALVFLGLVDISFNLQQHVYCTSIADAAMNSFINLFSLGFGLCSIIVGWKMSQRDCEICKSRQ